MATQPSAATSPATASDRPGTRRPLPLEAPLEVMRQQLGQRSALEELGPLFDGPAAPPHQPHHSAYR